jgi:hypothetical protein
VSVVYFTDRDLVRRDDGSDADVELFENRDRDFGLDRSRRERHARDCSGGIASPPLVEGFVMLSWETAVGRR